MKNDNSASHSAGRILQSVRKFPFSELTTHASSITFFFFISMIPLFILAFALFPFTGITEAQILELLNIYTPAAAEGMIASIVHQAYTADISVYSVSILFMIWSSSQSMNALTNSLNSIHHVVRQRRYITRLLLNILNTMIIIVLLVYLLSAHSLKTSMLENMRAVLADIPFVDFLTRTTNYITIFITAVLILSLIYTVVPDGKRNYFQQMPGAACASLGWILFSLLFRVYINGANIYKSFYGSLAAAAIFLFWLYCCFMILLLGALVNQYMEENVFLKSKRIHMK